MTANLSPAERERIRGLVRILQATPKPASCFWCGRILDALEEGPATRSELMYALGARHRSRHERQAIEKALQSLLDDGLVRERPELTPARGVRIFSPVRVLELNR